MLILMGHITLAPSDVAEFLADTRDFVANTRKLDGCLFYSIAMDDQASGRVLTVERWKDQDALTAHTQRPEMAEVMGKWMGTIKMDIQKYDASNERDLTN
ncbi:Quinol monooxygenase YgiN [Monaibacterium marinum]|uniref:Quinol monooxygenase YgiN n=1 Tax=Pontivivens marinum TaxID=1690039 RepID=A0A2C9CVP6_9RHOB|nr:putative quinol monooxygenase [Monaibacterium marinum]SOH95347.1 Quinol monooxygenase YgiN [Monaibacterium marinum]